MPHKSRKVLIILIPIILIAVIAIVLTMLYIRTDFLKSDKTLFLKYILQNVDVAKTIIDNTDEKELTNILRQNKYEATSELSGSYTEKINTSEENKNNNLNKIKVVSETQSDYLNNYNYKNINVLFDNTDILKAELIQDNDILGVRFTEGFNQFLTVENNNLKEEAKKAGFTDEQIELIPERIEEMDYNNIFTFTDEELVTLKEKYLDIISRYVPDDCYSKQSNAMITINQSSINTTAYSVSLTQEQANNLYIKILEALKEDEIILNKISKFEDIAMIYNKLKNSENNISTRYLQDKYILLLEEKINNITENNIGTSEVKYTVYVSNGRLVRTQVFESNMQTTLDYNIGEESAELTIQNIAANNEQEDERKIQIKKSKNGEETEFIIKSENTLGSETSKVEIYRRKSINDVEALIKNGIEYDDGKGNILNLKLDENINLNQNFEKKIELDDQNSVKINNYEEELVSKWAGLVKEFLQNKLQANKTVLDNIRKIKIIGVMLGEPKEEPIAQEDEVVVSDVEKNRFNARFEFYTGKEKSTEEVLQLLEEAKTSLKGVQVAFSNEGTTQENKKLQAIKLTIEDGTKNEEMVKELKERLEENKTYTVEITKNSNNLVETIMITMNK